jgi:hypothetical protein
MAVTNFTKTSLAAFRRMPVNTASFKIFLLFNHIFDIINGSALQN